MFRLRPILKNNWYKTYIRASDENILERTMGFKISKKALELTQMSDNGLEVIMTNGEYQQIYDKWIYWYNRDDSYWNHFIRYLVIASIVILAIIMLLLVFNHILQNWVRYSF